MRAETGIDFDERGAALSIAANINVSRAVHAHRPRRRER